MPHRAQETGIPKDTLYAWRSQARRAQGLAVPAQERPAAQGSSAAKFVVVVERAALTEAELSAYCRQTGLYPEQVAGWRQACQQANGLEALSRPAERAPEEQAQKLKQLERELRRKEKALAEATALLVLQKKAQALWGESEDGH